MTRCLELAKLAGGHVAPNPMVGALFVHEGRVIGEGYHRQYGQAHAEVNCINSVKEKDGELISHSTMYVSLEPCAHFGKTPPCSDLIIRHAIPKVVIGCRDPFDKVNGKGIEKLQNAGIEVKTGILENECITLNKRFFTFHTRRRPYIILKWAQTADRKIAGYSEERLYISNEISNRLVHQWRSEEAAVLVGTNTALLDNPLLSNRLWSGGQPVRLVADRYLRLPSSLHIFNRQQRTILFNTIKQEEEGNLLYYKVTEEKSLVSQITEACYQLNIQSILAEGGAGLLQLFIEADIWDETRIITNNTLMIREGLAAPALNNYQLINKEEILNNTIQYFKHG
jgi:diaminohydroxyphosphoribosylaminopyrimidine deaminase/5-amino-6-(5-phosphoribosylamino)uracil reductase